MPTPLALLAGAAILAAGGYGVGSTVVDSGGTSSAPAVRAPALAADPTGRPAHAQFAYRPPAAQAGVPQLPALQGQAPNGGGGPAAGPSYVPKGNPLGPLGRLAVPGAAPTPNTWTLYLSGGDLLQPDPGAADGTDQSIGPNLGGPCGAGMAGKWTAPATVDVDFHGPVPGLLHVTGSSPVTLNISFIRYKYGGSCSVLSSTTASGTGVVPFSLPRIDVTVPRGENVSLVVTGSSTHVTSSAAAPSYIIAPTSSK